MLDDDTRTAAMPSGRWVTGRALLFAAASLALAGVVARAFVLAGREGRLGGDEAYAGLQAHDVLGGDLPVVIHGAVYTAVFESYLFAPVTLVAGSSIVALKVLFVVVWALASVAAALLARSLLGGVVAPVVAGGLVWLAPGALLVVSTLAYPGYALGMGTSTVVALLAARLADGGGVERRATLVAAGALGLATGLTAWIHPMFLATAAPAVAVALVARRRDWRDVVPVTAAGAVVGAGPFLLWNAVNGWPSITDRATFEGTYVDRLDAIVTDLLPRALGLKDDLLEWRHGPVTGVATYLAVVLVVAAGAVALARSSDRPSRWVVPVVLIGAVPLMAALPPLIFAQDGRYAVIPLPFAAVAVAALPRLARDLPTAARWAGGAVLVAMWAVLLVAPPLHDAIDTRNENPNAAYRAVVARLDAAGIDHLNGSFWQVLPIDYVSGDDLVTAVLPYYSIRFTGEQRAVERADPATVAFVFSLFDEDTAWLPLPVERYSREQIGDVILYLPFAAG